MDLEEFELVVLRRPDPAAEYDDAQRQRIHVDHLAFYARLRAAGHVVVNGPLVDQPDPSVRGLSFYPVGAHPA
jgi:hypothetical protein